MKHLIKNNQIIMSGIPGHFTRENGEGFWGGYENRTDIHYEDGWRDEVIPEYDPLTHQSGTLYYSELQDIVTCKLIPVPIDVDAIKNRLSMELGVLRKEIADLITQIKLYYDNEPEELTLLLSQIRGMYARAKQEIKALGPETVNRYILHGPQVEELFNRLKSML
jgi:hypothetical protein